MYIARYSRRSVLRSLALGSVLLPALPALASVRPAAAEEELTDIPLAIPRDIGANEHWVDVNLTQQTAVAMIGEAWTRVALVTTGKPEWETPEGEFRIVRRVPNETMTSASLGITDPNDQYVLTNVLYTQYFTWAGHAIHLNYWRPDSVFGYERTSHGCVGVRMADAEYLWRHVGMGSRVVIHA